MAKDLDRLEQMAESVRALSPEERERILEQAKALKALTAEELAALSEGRPAAACGPCDPCGMHGEIGIEPGW